MCQPGTKSTSDTLPETLTQRLRRRACEHLLVPICAGSETQEVPITARR
jgi:hypothetical protein